MFSDAKKFSGLGLLAHYVQHMRIHPLLRIENQAPNLDGLPRRRALGAGRIQERSVRRQPRLVGIRVETLDQRHLVRRLVGQVVPTQLRVVLDGERASDAVWVDETHGDEVVIDVESAPVRNCELLVRDGVANGAPDVDNANAGLEETLRLVLEVVVYALDARIKGLIDMHALLREG